MKTIAQYPVLTLKLEKDDPKNITGMQLKVWLLNNNTEVLVRLYKHDDNVKDKTRSKKRTNGEAEDMVLEFLKKMKVIRKISNWESSTERTSELAEQDDIEKDRDENGDEEQNYIYFSWYVKPELINF